MVKTTEKNFYLNEVIWDHWVEFQGISTYALDTGRGAHLWALRTNVAF